MPYTGDPAGSPSDAVRLRVGDTNPASPLLADAEVLYFLSSRSDSVVLAAVDAARALAAKYASSFDKAVGDLRLAYSQRATQYRDLADRLEAEAAGGGDGTLSMWVAGTSISEMQAEEVQVDRPQPDFYRGQDRNPRSSPGPYETNRWGE